MYFWRKACAMTKQVVILNALLRLLNISIVEEKKMDGPSPDNLRSFYDQFHLNLSDYTFDRDLANER